MERKNKSIFKALEIMDNLAIELKVDIDETNRYRSSLSKIKNVINQLNIEVNLNKDLRKMIEEFLNNINIKKLNKKIVDILYLNDKEKEELSEGYINKLTLKDLSDVGLMKLLCKVLSGVSYSQKNELLLLKYNKSIWCIGWNEYYKACRGKIIDINTKEIISYPYDKFFNLNEMDETRVENIQEMIDKAEYISLMDKVDGSIISVSKYKNELLVTSNGGFDNEQIDMAKKLLHDKYKNFKDNLKEGYTYIFEVIYPKDKKVVDYGEDKKLILLGVRDLKTKNLLRYEECKEMCLEWNLELVKSIDYISLEDLIYKSKSLINSNKEGWVLRIITKDSEIMVKIKLEEYCRLHKSILSDVNPFNIYDLIYNNQLDDALVNMNDLIKENVMNIVDKVFFVLNNIEGDLNKNLEEVKSKFDITRDEFAETSTDKSHPKYKNRIELMKYINENCNRYHTLAGIYQYYSSKKEISDIIKEIDVNTFKRICKKENINFEI